MRRFLIAMCVALAGVCASAQEKGDMAVGLNLGVAPCLESGASVTNFGIGAKFQYNITNPIRLEAAFDYGFKDKEIDVMTLGINGHYLVKFNDKLNIYPLVGLGYARLSGNFSISGDDIEDIWGDDITAWANENGIYADDIDGSVSSNKLFFNVGVGFEYAINSKLSVGAEIKYQYIKDFNRLPINIGVTYHF